MLRVKAIQSPSGDHAGASCMLIPGSSASILTGVPQL
jgi:hypothetical protein